MYIVDRDTTLAKEKPKELFVMSDKFTAYPMALQFIQVAKQKIEILNRVFKESYRITTGYFNISGARHSFELWLFYFNYMRRSNGFFKNPLDFIDTKNNIENFNMPAKWALVFDYVRFKLSS